MNTKPIDRIDHQFISTLIPTGSAILDLGCGIGDLLALLVQERKVRGHGIEIDEKAIYQCVAKGLNVLHGDIEGGLAEYSEKSFDFVILNQSLQQVKHFEFVLLDALRVGKKVIIGFPNFAYFKARCQLFFKGKAPVTPSLPFSWYDSPNVHFFSIRDFLEFCRRKEIRIEKAAFFEEQRRTILFPNLFANIGIFLIGR